MKHVILVAGAVALALLLLGCPSTPPAPPAEEPVVEAPAEPVAEEPVVEAPAETVAEQPVEPAPAAVTDAEVGAAEAALARARDWAAEYYARAAWEDASSAFAEALAARGDDPDRARGLLLASIGKSDAAYQAAVAGFTDDMSGRVIAARERLVAMEADRWMPTEYEDALAVVDDAQALHAAGDFEEARTVVFGALRGLIDLGDDLEMRLGAISMLRDETENAMARAEELEAAVWAPEQREAANDRFLAALLTWGNHDLVGCEASFPAARDSMTELVNLVLDRRVTQAVEDHLEAERLMEEVMRQLEEASRLSVVGDDGTLIGPRPWSAEDEMRRLEEESQPTSMAIPRTGTVVLGDVSTVAGILDQARAEWRRGVAAQDRGEPGTALEHFRQAQRLIEIYRSRAVEGTYVVRLVPEARDCLWRIAAYPSVYGNPRLWPLLWLQNWASIPDPDLIEPGMVLAIGPIGPERDRQLAEASWLAGQQYELAGNGARAREYQAAALKLWPALDPRAVALPGWFDAAGAVAGATTVEAPAAGTFVESVRSAFLRLGGAFRDGNADAMLAFFAGSLYLSDRGEELDRDRIRVLLEQMLADESVADLPWSEVFDLDNLLFGEEAVNGDPAIVMAARVGADLPGDFGRAGSSTYFHYRRIAGAWKIVGLGLTGVPAAWEPVAAPAVVAFGSPPTDTVPTAETVRDVFTDWLGAWLEGDRARGIALTGPTLELREAGDRLTGDEVGTLLETWFGDTMVQGYAVDDVVDADGAIVEAEDDGTWRVSVRSPLDLSDAIPYWKSYQDYWLALDGNDLQVIAVF